jgi:hypothetical protein
MVAEDEVQELHIEERHGGRSGGCERNQLLSGGSDYSALRTKAVEKNRTQE